MQETLLTDARVRVSATAALVALTFLALVASVTGLSEMRYIGAGVSASNTISVSGEGEVFAVPDIATFTVTIREEADDVETAQTVATEKANDIIAYIRSAGIEDKDIKTASYNVSPRYEWQEAARCVDAYCPSGKQVLIGYEVYQSLSVKVRKTDEAGAILTEVGKRGASEVSGLSFTIDEDETLKAEARAQAIADAQAKAEVLARDLGVRLVRVVGFSEGYTTPKYAAREMMALDSASAVGGATPELPLGENKIMSNVNVTYEIR